jgi:hypothetical protein
MGTELFRADRWADITKLGELFTIFANAPYILDAVEVNGKLHILQTSPPINKNATHCFGSWVGPRAGFHVMTKKSLPWQESNASQPAHCHSPYSLSYFNLHKVTIILPLKH